jgi:flagellar biosynthesis/type III secretory pathway protein FliH
MKRLRTGLLPGVSRIPGLEAARLRSLTAAIEGLEQEHRLLEQKLADLGEKARAAGYAQGRKEAIQEALSLLAEAGRTRDQMLKANLSGIAKLATRIAEKVIAERIESPPSVTGKIIEEVVSQTGEIKGATAYLNPQDIETLDRGWRRPEGISIAPDSSIPRGGCRIEAGDRIYECGVNERLERIADEMDAGGRQ